ncbi:RNA 2',3'-cyclic phosphodiesterase [Alphaproteobacteria bacterium SO-S41]|nr:RNA 2',3'-cyclic phosphodiesterase [Alphaproteobacteria bacterium SO-S41]
MVCSDLYRRNSYERSVVSRSCRRTSCEEKSLVFCVCAVAEVAADIHERGAKQYGLMRSGGSLIRQSQLHITVRYIGSYPLRLPKAIVAKARLAGSFFEFPEFSAELDVLGSFLSPRSQAPCVLSGSRSVASLMEAQWQLGLAMTKAGLDVLQDDNFDPHITLFYHRQSVERRRIEPVRLKIGELVLIHSLYGLTRHIVLERWPLGVKRR